VGDAAHQVNPVTGAGIITGMIAGMEAGQAAADAIKHNDLSCLEEYPKQWQKRVGWKHEAYYKIKDGIDLPDEIYNKIAEDINRLPQEKRTIGAIFRTAFWNKPSLLLEVAKIFLT
jgi:digeranylgeranylglycerophospholipid reductase